MKRKTINGMTEAKREALLDEADRYWEHHDRHGSNTSALKTRAKMFPRGIPMRPLISKENREQLKNCQGCSTKLFIDEESLDYEDQDKRT